MPAPFSTSGRHQGGSLPITNSATGTSSSGSSDACGGSAGVGPPRATEASKGGGGMTRRASFTLHLPIENTAPAMGHTRTRSNVNFAKRRRIFQEIIETEEKYCNDLAMVCDKFRAPLLDVERKSFGQHPPIKATAVHAIFSNLPSIRHANTTLLKVLKRALLNKDERRTQTFARIFTRLATILSLYCDYTVKYQMAISVLREKRLRKPRFQKFLDEVEATSANGARLEDFLIKPIQRICRYPLLLKEVLKHTEDGHPDKEAVQHAQSVMASVAEDMNAYEKRSANIMQVIEIFQRLGGASGSLPDLLQPERQLVAAWPESVAYTRFSALKSPKSCQVFLFTDSLLIARSNRGMMASEHGLHSKFFSKLHNLTIGAPLDEHNGCCFSLASTVSVQDPSGIINTGVERFVLHFWWDRGDGDDVLEENVATMMRRHAELSSLVSDCKTKREMRANSSRKSKNSVARPWRRRTSVSQINRSFDKYLQEDDERDGVGDGVGDAGGGGEGAGDKGGGEGLVDADGGVDVDSKAATKDGDASRIGDLYAGWLAVQAEEHAPPDKVHAVFVDAVLVADDGGEESVGDVKVAEGMDVEVDVVVNTGVDVDTDVDVDVEVPTAVDVEVNMSVDVEAGVDVEVPTVSTWK